MCHRIFIKMFINYMNGKMKISNKAFHSLLLASVDIRIQAFIQF